MNNEMQDPRKGEDEAVGSEDPTEVIADFWPNAYVNVSTKSGIDAVKVDDPTVRVDVPPFPPPVDGFARAPGRPKTDPEASTRPEISRSGAQVRHPIGKSRKKPPPCPPVVEELISDSIPIVVVLPDAPRQT